MERELLSNLSNISYDSLHLNVSFDRVNGKRYFDCQPKYGSMVPVANVTIGDFPPENYDDEL